MLRWRKLRLEASCSLFIRPSVRALPRTRGTSASRKRIARHCGGNSGIFSPPAALVPRNWENRDLRHAGFVARQLQRMDGSHGAIYPPVEICGRWGGRLITLSQRPEIKCCYASGSAAPGCSKAVKNDTVVAATLPK